MLTRSAQFMTFGGRPHSLAILFFFTMAIILVSWGGQKAHAAGGCPDHPSCNGEDLDYFVTDSNTGQEVTNGMVVPTWTPLLFHAIATAYGQCDMEIPNCAPLPCTCECCVTYERTVNHIGISLDVVSQFLNGWYMVGYIWGVDEDGLTAFYQVLDSHSEYSTGPVGGVVAYPGTYTYTFGNIINNPNCLFGVCPDDVTKSVTIYGSDSFNGANVNNACNVIVGKGVSVANGIVTTRETDFTLPGAIPIEFSRYYNSYTATTWLARGFGITWGHTYDTKIEQIQINLYKVTNPNGSIVYYSDTDGDTIFEAIIPKGETSDMLISADGYTRRFENGITEEFNTSGTLSAIVDRNGNTLTFGRDASNNLTSITDASGRIVSLAYDSSNRIIAISLPDSGTINYQYAGSGLQQVTYPDATSRTYEYLLTNLMGAKNENGHYVKKFTYDYEGRAITSSTDGINDKITLTYVDSEHTTVTDSLGRTTTYTFDRSGGKNHSTSISGPGCSECGQSDVSYAYDENLNIVSSTDGNGNQTTYAYDLAGNMIQKTEAYGTQDERTTSYTYNQYGDVLTETDPDGNTTTNTYDANGNLLSTTDAQGNTTTYTYDAMGLRISETDPRGNTTNYSYDQYGNLQGIQDPVSNTVDYTHDIMGRVLSMTNANNGTTSYLYDLRGRLTRATAPDEGITEYEYDPAGNIIAVTYPTGSTTTSTYDSAGRLVLRTDADGNSISYTYDTQGNVTSATVKNCSQAVTTSDTYEYDDRNRLVKTTHADATYMEYGYDANGNLTTIRDENDNTHIYEYDALDRIHSVTNPLEETTFYSYDKRDNLTEVTDPNGNATQYIFDSVNHMISQVSPDTGTTAYSYDENGNLQTKTDAQGVLISYQYDAANRLSQVQFPDPGENVSYSYDTCPSGKGLICGMADPSGTTSFEYDVKGQITKQEKQINGVTYVTLFSYDQNGNLASITHPKSSIKGGKKKQTGGSVVTYNHSNNKTAEVLLNGVPIASNVTYLPFGGVTSVSYGNGIERSVAYDQRYRITSIDEGGIQSLAYAYDNKGNVTGITNNIDGANNKLFTYDPLDRLTGASGPWGVVSYTYDPVGNRLTETTDTGTTNYSYTANRLTGAAGEKSLSYSYDQNGNITAENQRAFLYNQNHRLIRVAEDSVTLAEYAYNGTGQRIKAEADNDTMIFHYDLKGHIIAESASDGIFTAEYIYLNDQPLAKVEQGNVYYYHNDHLGTPQKMTDSSALTAWEGEFLPFGEEHAVGGVLSNNFRFAGQYYDSETGLHYNYWRYYDPKLGRYLRPDPIGLLGGINLYSYAQNNPIKLIDPFGTEPCSCEEMKACEKACEKRGGVEFCGKTHVPILGDFGGCKCRGDDCEEQAQRDDDFCYKRWEREYSACSQWAKLGNRVVRACRTRAADRRNLCIANGGKPNPAEPPEYNPFVDYPR